MPVLKFLNFTESNVDKDLVLLDKAIKRKNEILKDHFPSHISEELDVAIREKFPIFLPREAVSKENV